MSWLNDFLRNYYITQAPLLHLKDGTTLSVQVGPGLYHTARTGDDGKQLYTHVEVGYPTGPIPPSWMPYCEDKLAPNNTIYSFLPIELVHYFIASHGGVDYEKTLGDGDVMVE